MTGQKLPDCMMPDGADPCLGYLGLAGKAERQAERIAALEAQRDAAVEALGNLLEVHGDLAEQCVPETAPFMHENDTLPAIQRMGNAVVRARAALNQIRGESDAG